MRQAQFSVTVDLSQILALIIFGLSPWSSSFWYFLPVAVFICLISKSRAMRAVPAIFFVGFLVFLTEKTRPDFTSLDALGIVFFLGEGVLLYWLNRKRWSFLKILMLPFAVGWLASLVLFLMESGGSFSHYETWTALQVKSSVFPSFFDPQIWGDEVADLYAQFLTPLFQAGLWAWFGGVLGMTFFVNAIARSFVVAGNSTEQKKSQAFQAWRSSDYTLVPLVLGLGALVAGYELDLTSHRYLLLVTGWNLSLAAIFPLLVHGAALASFFLSLAPSFLSFLIIVVLFLFPLPSLVLAGLFDLWFDFRSRMRSNP